MTVGTINETITYKKEATNPAADNEVSTYTYKLGTDTKAKTVNTTDSYHRLTKKAITIGSKQFTKQFTYNIGRVTKLTNTVGSTALETYSYGYDEMGRIASVTSTGGKSIYYAYDQYGQLIREDNMVLDKTILYEYDNNGNVTSVKAYSYTQDDAPSGTPATTAFGYGTTYPDRLTSFGGTSISYNSIGCPTSYDGKTASWTRGKLSRLSSGTLASGTKSYTYSYNAFGQRVSRAYASIEGTSGVNQMQTGEVTAYSKHYYYDHVGRLMAETTTKTLYSQGTSTERIVYLYDESAMVGMEYTSGSTTKLYYFQRNLQGDVTAIYDTSGNLIAKYLYDAWGNCTISSDTTNTVVANANPIRYRGYYYDADTGLYYCNARYYSPKWRRFISPDDTAYLNPESVNGLNLYIYANNNPVNTLYSSSNTGRNYCGVANAPAARTTNISSGATSRQQNIPLWVGGLITGASSIHGLVDSISSYLAGTADGLLSYIGASKLNDFQSGLGKYTNWLMGIGIGLDVLSSAYKNYTNPSLTSGQKWSSFGADVCYIAVKSTLSYLAGFLVTKGAVALGYAAMGATLGTFGFVGAIALGAGVVVLGIIAGTILISILSDAADNLWNSKKEEWFS